MNLGNTCFLNSILQALGSTRAFRDLVTGEWIGGAPDLPPLGDQSQSGERGEEAQKEGESDEEYKMYILQRLQAHWEDLRDQSPALTVVDDEYGRRKRRRRASSIKDAARDNVEDGKGQEAEEYEPTALDLPLTMALVHLLMKAWNVSSSSSNSAPSALPASTSSSSSNLSKDAASPSSPASKSASRPGSSSSSPTKPQQQQPQKQQQQQTLNPRTLFKGLSKIFEQYNDYEQQDSHEALRLLLDRCRMEEMDVIKKIRKGKGKEDKGGEEDGKVETLRPLVDMVFEGKLASMIICQGCGYVSAIAFHGDMRPR